MALDHLLVYLPFDETNGSVAYDHTGNANHGRLIDQAQWSAGKMVVPYPLMAKMTAWSLIKGPDGPPRCILGCFVV